MDNELEELSALLSDCEESDKATSSKIPVKHEKCDEKNKLKKLHDFDIFNREQDTPQSTEKILPSLSQLFGKNSAIHEGDTDSSEDEDNRNASEPKYNDSGRAIKHLITKQDEPTTSRSKSSSWKSKTTLFAPSETPKTSGAKPQKDIFMDPFFGLRIVTPLISSQILKDKMQGRTAVRFNGLQNHLTNLDKSKDWVLGGVITSRFMKTSQKGTPYAIWILSDLREDMKTVSVFLFGKAYKNLWKTNTHIAVAILNPTPLENRKTSNDIAALSVNDADQVMILGQSKDLGTCKAKKKNGEPCTAMVNVTECDYCIYHVKEAYRKFNARSELQAPSGGSLTNLKNKVLGRNEVFYAGKIFTGRVAKPTRKQVVKDKKRLSQLFNQCESRLGPQTQATQEVKSAQSARVMLMKDAARLQKLTGSPATLNALALGDKCSSKKISTDGKNPRQILPKKMESGDKLKPLRLPMKMEELKCNEKQTHDKSPSSGIQSCIETPSIKSLTMNEICEQYGMETEFQPKCKENKSNEKSLKVELTCNKKQTNEMTPSSGIQSCIKTQSGNSLTTNEILELYGIDTKIQPKRKENKINEKSLKKELTCNKKQTNKKSPSSGIQSCIKTQSGNSLTTNEILELYGIDTEIQPKRKENKSNEKSLKVEQTCNKKQTNKKSPSSRIQSCIETQSGNSLTMNEILELYGIDTEIQRKRKVENPLDGLELEIYNTDKSTETGCRKRVHHDSRKLNPDRSLIKNKNSNQQTLDVPQDKLKSGTVSKPTKDRFDNLIRLQSVSSKRNKSAAACENFLVESSKDLVQNICLRPNVTITNVSQSVSEGLPDKRLMKDAARPQKLTGSPATLTALALGDKSGSKKDSTDGKNSRQILPEKMESGDNLKPLRLPMKMEELKCNEKQTGNTNQDKNCGIAPQGNPKPPGKPIKNTSDGLELEICGTDKSAETGCRKSAHHGSRKLNPDRSLIKNKKSNQQTLDIHDKLKSGIVSKPTKDRFDNLIKLQSVSSKRNKSDAACENFPVECSKDSVQNICLRPNSTITNVSHSVSENLPVKRTKDSININSPKPKNDVNNPDRENFPVKRLRDLVHTDSPRLSNFGAFNFSVPSQHSAAKMKALKYVEKKGPICKENEKKSKSNKRKRADEAEEESASPKSTLSARFLELMNATSKHTDLITVAEDNEMEAYYDKMEKKEKMEEKMLNTYKVDCKAVRCLKCNYKWFSASEKCKTEKHPIKVISAVKRFFKCSNCSNRTCTLELIPLHNCKNCQNGHWVRTSMMKERKSATVPLSIRGGEQKFTNSVVTDTNLDLLVPDE